jgi:hypothetical protein
MKNIMTELVSRQAPPSNATVEMIGDLLKGATTPVGHQVQNCLLGTGPCQNLDTKVNTSIQSMFEV